MSMRHCEWRVCAREQTTLSHPFIKSHPTVYKFARATWKKLMMNEINVCKMKELIIHPIVWAHLCGTLKVPMGSPKYPMEFPGGEFYWKRKEQSGNLENPTQMLSYNQLNFISFQGLVLIIWKIIMTKTKIIHTNYRLQISLIYMYTWILKF